jgi:DUF1009 family protein
MAGGFRKMRAVAQARPDWAAIRVLAKARTLRDDELLRAVAAFYEAEGLRVIAPTDILERVLAPVGLIAGSPLSAAQEHDVALGFEVGGLLGQADVGQTVVVKNGNVLALEAVEGTDETIRRGAKLGGPGCVVVKRSKPQQDRRLDLPAAGPETLGVMAEVGARVLAIEARSTILVDLPELCAQAERLAITVVGVAQGTGSEGACPRK